MWNLIPSKVKAVLGIQLSPYHGSPGDDDDWMREDKEEREAEKNKKQSQNKGKKGKKKKR